MSIKYNGPVVLCVLDGVGLSKENNGNAVKMAHTEFLNRVAQEYSVAVLQASGEAVGILPGNMGNSEVGHIALGAGQIIKQGIAKIEESFDSGQIWQSEAWRGAIQNIKEHNSTLHFSGIFSDGNVHSNIHHLLKMVTRAHEEGVQKIRVHLVLDGRDVPPQSEPKFIQMLEDHFASFVDHPDYCIASGGGRMVHVADRYESDWNVVKAGWDAIVYGKAPHQFASATEAVKALRTANADLQDQYMPSFVIVRDGEPVGTVADGDSFIYYDFRADRAVEIAQAFTYEDFPHFDRGTPGNRRLDVFFAGMTEYNNDTHVPQRQLVEPSIVTDTLHDFLGEHGVTQLAASETVKFGHITYYFSGNSYDKAPGEEHLEIPSDTLPFNTRPWMKSAEITDAVLEQMDKYQFVRINYPGGDMVGHFGDLEATITAMEAIDIQLARLAAKVDELGGMLIITADHGNAEELLDETGQPKTAHSTNPVPCIFYDNTKNASLYQLDKLPDAGLSNVAATLALLLGQDSYPESWRKPLIKLI